MTGNGNNGINNKRGGLFFLEVHINIFAQQFFIGGNIM